MAAETILDQIRKAGGDVQLLADGKLALVRRSVIPNDLANQAKSHADELRRILQARPNGDGEIREFHPAAGSTPPEDDAELEERLKRWAIVCAEAILATAGDAS